MSGKAFNMFWRKTETVADDTPAVCVVTPVYNGIEYIDETIHSLLSQAGDFDLHYHIQDGGSTDGTLERVKYWMKEARRLPKLCNKLIFTMSSEPDGGMYDAINKGFARALPAGDDVVMGWIAADDRIAPGAFSTIFGIRRAFPDIRFIGGRISLLDSTGSIIGVNAIHPFSRLAMAAGLYDGRALTFIMQEGTFWCADLWRKVGGLDTRFRLGGDWDLWRRLAAHAEYVSADSVLGFHRRRPGQLSEQMGRYYTEVDNTLSQPAAGLVPDLLVAAISDSGAASLDGTLRDVYDSVLLQYEEALADGVSLRLSGHACSFVRFNLNGRYWERVDGFGHAASGMERVTSSGTSAVISIRPTTGFRAPEGPYPEFGLSRVIRWILASTASGEFVAPRSGDYRIVLRCRSWTQGQSITIMVDDRPWGKLQVKPHGHDRDIELTVVASLKEGRHVVALQIEPVSSSEALLVVDWLAEELIADTAGIVPVSEAPLATTAITGRGGLSHLPRISIVVPTRNQAHFIRDTLKSIRRQGYPNLEVIVVDGVSSDQTLAIVREFGRHITHIISEPDKGQSEAINKGFAVATGDILTWLNSDDILEDDALNAIAHAFMTTKVDIVAGVCSIFNNTNAVVHAHMPCLSSGPLPLADILDLENSWLRGKFFHQPEVFFTRDIWLRSGGRVDEALFYSMDYDLWVRMAQQNATIKVIGTPIALFRMHNQQKTSTVEAYRPELTAHAKKVRRKVGLTAMPAPKQLTSRLRIIFFNDVGFKYGAGIAHRRLALALAALGHEVEALAYADLDYGRPDRELSAAEVAEALISLRPNLIVIGNLHAISADFDLIGALVPSDIPVIFYGHDQWLATGRCGYTGPCERYQTLCNARCPTAASFPALSPNVIASAYKRKRDALAAGAASKFAVLTNSRYLSSFFKHAFAEKLGLPVRYAPIGIDCSIFVPGERWRARQILSLPRGKFIIMTAAANIADPRKGGQLLLDAAAEVAKDRDILVIIMGYGEEIKGFPFEVRFTGYITKEEVIAIYYQAADIFVGPSIEEAFGQTYIEAAACGLPSIGYAVGGVPEAIIDGVTGFVLKDRNIGTLAAAIDRLAGDAPLRLEFGFQARFHASNNFSLQASAASWTSTLVELKHLGIPLVPTVVFPGGHKAEVPCRYLIARQVESVETTDWIALEGLNEERRTADWPSLPNRFWWASWPACKFLVRAASSGPHILQIMVNNGLNGQRLEIQGEDGRVTAIDLAGGDFDTPRKVSAVVDLQRGLNCITISFSKRIEDNSDPRLLAVLIRSIDIWPHQGISRGPRDGAFELLDGFDQEEGPYPEIGINCRFRWASGKRSTFQFYSAKSGYRRLKLRVRNPHEDQRLIIRINDKVVASRAVIARMSEATIVPFDVDLSVGLQTLSVDTTRQLESATDPRKLSFLFENFSIAAADEGEDEAIDDAIRWDLSNRISPMELPDLKSGLTVPYRWAYASRVSIVVDRQRASDVSFGLQYRCANSVESALLFVNGQASGRIFFDHVDFSESRQVKQPISLWQGENSIELEFDLAPGAAPPDHDLYLMIEDVTLEPVGSSESDNEALSPVRWIYGEGFSHLEGAYLERGITRPFCWSLKVDSTIAFSQPASEITLRLRNNIPDQLVDIMSSEGVPLVSVVLQDALDELQDVSIKTSEGLRGLILRPSLASEGYDEDPRHLAFILDSILDKEGRVMTGVIPSRSDA